MKKQIIMNNKYNILNNNIKRYMDSLLGDVRHMGKKKQLFGIKYDDNNNNSTVYVPAVEYIINQKYFDVKITVYEIGYYSTSYAFQYETCSVAIQVCLLFAAQVIVRYCILHQKGNQMKAFSIAKHMLKGSIDCLIENNCKVPLDAKKAITLRNPYKKSNNSNKENPKPMVRNNICNPKSNYVLNQRKQQIMKNTKKKPFHAWS